VLTEWLNSSLKGTRADRCAYCGEPEKHSGDALLPFGTGPHAWVHYRCQEAWRTARHAEAIEVLMCYGVTT
jgi:hypothetical protein